jgi:hypothetical protein
VRETANRRARDTLTDADGRGCVQGFVEDLDSGDDAVRSVRDLANNFSPVDPYRWAPALGRFPRFAEARPMLAELQPGTPPCPFAPDVVCQARPAQIPHPNPPNLAPTSYCMPCVCR